jgi:hypothetical protein
MFIFVSPSTPAFSSAVVCETGGCGHDPDVYQRGKSDLLSISLSAPAVSSQLLRRELITAKRKTQVDAVATSRIQVGAAEARTACARHHWFLKDF